MTFPLQYLALLLTLSLFATGLLASDKDAPKVTSGQELAGQDAPFVDSLLQITESEASDSVVAGAFLELASHFLKINSVRSFYYSQKAHDLSQQSLASGRYTRHEDSLVFFSIMAAALNRMGFSAKRRGEISKSLDWHMQAAQLSEHIGDSTHLSSALHNIGALYFQLGEIEKTIENMERSLAIREAMRDTALIASSLQATGSIYSRTGDFETAQNYFEKALVFSQQTGFERVTALSQFSLGTVFARQGRFEEAMAYYDKSAETSGKLNDYAMLISTIYSKAGVLRDLGRTDEAIQLSNIALTDSKKHELFNGRDRLYLRMSELHTLKGNTDSAFFHYRKYIEVRDSILNARNDREIIRLEAQYEFGAKILADSLMAANQIREAQLRTEKQETLSLAFGIGILLLLVLLGTLILAYRAKAISNRKIALSLREKEMLIKEIHHRVKNNLAMVSNLLQLQGHLLEDAGAKAAIEEGKSRLNSIALIHQQLYQADQKTDVDMLDFINELVEELAFAYGLEERRITIDSQVQNMQLDVENAISLGLILHELLNNALKYAFPEESEGEIMIALKELNPQELELVVSDNGIGMPAEISEKSLGMRLIRLFSKELKGKHQFINQGGTRFELVFPKRSRLINT